MDDFQSAEEVRTLYATKLLNIDYDTVWFEKDFVTKYFGQICSVPVCYTKWLIHIQVAGSLLSRMKRNDVQNCVLNYM